MVTVTDQMREIAQDLLALIDGDQRVSPSVLEGNARRLAELVLAQDEPVDNKVSCITCSVRRHPSNMVNVYDGEYQCQECRWGL